MNPYFRFKQFTVWHDKCAMKVGTDGVLLGAWCAVGSAGSILDVGTGSGLIALMLAQRSNALIDAIDIDEGAFAQASENINASPFGERVNARHTSLSNYAKQCGKRYGLIVSNPPYFAKSLKCPDKSRSQARHNDTLAPAELIGCCKSLLAGDGRIALIFPCEQLDNFTGIIGDHSLYVSRITTVFPMPGSPPRRILLEASARKPAALKEDSLAIELSRHQYTEEYINLTKDYYLKM